MLITKATAWSHAQGQEEDQCQEDSPQICLRWQGDDLLACIRRGKKKTSAKKTALRFEYGGKDMTCLEQRLTQAEIDRVLGCDLLVRSVFHGQADITALLEVRRALSTHFNMPFQLLMLTVPHHCINSHLRWAT